MSPAELRDLRRRLGWSQEEAAARLDLSQRSYRYTEQGTNAHGKPLPDVPRPVAVMMLTFALIADIESGPVSPARLSDFCLAIRRETQQTTSDQ